MEFYVNHPILFVLAGLLVSVVLLMAFPLTIAVARVLYKRGVL